MASIVVAGNTSGSVTLAAPDVAGTTTLTLPATSGTVMVNGPAFSAFASTPQSITSNVETKVQFNSKLFDTSNAYNNTTTYRFLPTVAGYYQINAQVQVSTNITTIVTSIFKNGSTYKIGNYTLTNGGANQASGLVYLNGSTDYVEIYVIFGTTQNIASGAATWFDGVLVRAA